MGYSRPRPSRAVKTDRIKRIVADALSTFHSSGLIDIDAIKGEHPDLMPELGAQLDTLISIQAARECAKQPEDESETTQRPWTQDLDNLREAMPNYEILEEIHYGGQGIVYRAIQRTTKRTVALKVLLEGLRATDRQRHRFEREAELISRLDHPNIVTLYESGLAHGRLYYVMQHLDGVPIDDYALVKDLTVRQIVELFVKVCRAVAYAHQNGIIHRDLHPANILVDPSGEPHLLDFGLAKDTYADPDVRISAPGQVVGALPYLSPEQVGGGDGNVDVRSDVYSLGVILYVLLTEQFPYRIQGSYGIVREEIVARDPVPLRRAFRDADPERRACIRDVTADLEAILNQTLAKEKRRRYQSAAALADDLDCYLSGDVVVARAANRLYLMRKTIRRHRVPLAILSVIIIALTFVSIVTSRSLANARRAAELAFEQFDMALRAIDSIEPLAGGTSVRDDLLRDISPALPKLSEYASADSAFSAISSKVAERLGDVAAAQGRREEARHYFEQYLAQAKKDWGTDSAQINETANVIRAYRKLGECSEDPSATFQEGLAFAQQTAENRPLGDLAQRELCRIRLYLGEYWKTRGTMPTAIPYLESALASYESRESADQDHEWNRLGARILSALGQIRIQQGDFDTGREYLERSKTLREAELATRPYDTAAHENIAAIYVRLAEIERHAGRHDQAIILAQQASEHYGLLHQLDPTVALWENRWFTTQVLLGQLHLTLQHIDAAEEYFNSAEKCLEDMMRNDPADEEMLASYALVLTDRGEILDTRRAYGEALSVFQQACEIRRRLRDADPSNLQKCEDLADTYQWLGITCGKVGDFDAAIENHRCAYQEYEELLRLNESSPDAILNLVGVQINLSSIYLRAGSPQNLIEAREHLHQAQTQLNHLHKTGLDRGYEGRFSQCQEAVDTNRRLVAKKEQSDDTDAPP